MDRSYQEQIKNFDNLIIKRNNLRELASHDAWKDLMKILSDMRVDAMDMAINEGDTTDAKAYARALGAIINQFYALSSENELEDLVSRRDQLKQEISMIEKDRLIGKNVNFGLSATI